MRRTRRDDQQIASPRGDDVILDQQVERAVEDVEQLGRIVVAVRVAATRPPTGAAQALLDLLAADINSRS